MKLSDKYTILFDADCAICSWAANTTTANSIFDQGNKTAYQEFSYAACPYVDKQRAANEVALVNIETGEVTYGLESLFVILKTVKPWLKPLLSFKPLIWLMTVLYKLFSYNRRVIFLPKKVRGTQPALNVGYRVAYLAITWLITSIVITKYVTLMYGLIKPGFPYREYLVCAGQLVFQGAMLYFIDKKKTAEYLGNMMTVSMGGALLLLVAIIVSSFASLPPAVYAFYFVFVVCLMFLEHIRRMKILDLGWAPTITWLFYRQAILLCIIHL